MVNAARITLTGHVQGVGFRPFVYRLAQQHKLNGYVQNRLGEVDIIACGTPASLDRFHHELVECAPPLAKPRITRFEAVDALDYAGFEIVASESDADARIFVPADHYMCDDCRRELHDTADRRYHYPFINCTQCGPRYTLIESLPYDRPNTSMAGFALCDACREEYESPSDRRFHAEPIACADCGPRLEFANGGAAEPGGTESQIALAVEALLQGNVVGVKGIGGYHLLADACNDRAVARLRQRKRRPAKPLAVMFPLSGSDGLDAVRDAIDIGAVEADALLDPARPIVLAAKKPDSRLAANIAPGLAEIGVFLPYSPLHDLLFEAFGGPLIATSGNISGEPVLTDNLEAATRLSDIADVFLHHNRPIVRPADDSVVRQIAGAIRPLRMGRGMAPVELDLPRRLSQPVLAVGGQMKGALALAWGNRVVISPHIGEMDNPRSMRVFEQVAADLQALYDIRAEHLLCDAHTGYTTHRWARRHELPFTPVFHHRAHAGALVGEFGLDDTWLVFAWDGVGFGEDGSIWGGEALLGTAGSWRRVASWRPFRLPGANLAGREPWRSAAALFWECGASWPGCPDPDGLVHAAWQSGINSPGSSAVGRLFDAAAAIVYGIKDASFEAEGPMQLEALCQQREEALSLPLAKDDAAVWRTDWQPLLDMLGDTARTPEYRAGVFHSSMAKALLDQAVLLRHEHGDFRVGLTGGVFQNRVLAEDVVEQLTAAGFDVRMPTVLPCNDAALSFGQVVEFAANRQEK